MPPYVAFMKSRSHIAFAGYLGKRYDPFIANQAARLPVYTNVGVDTGERVAAPSCFRLPAGLDAERIHDRRDSAAELRPAARRISIAGGSMEGLDSFQQQAVEMLLGRRARSGASTSPASPKRVRERYGKHLWCQQALLARRLVEAGVAFVTLDLSYHTASGTWDTHGDNIPPYGGISKGLGPLLPLFDHLITTLVGDLEGRGLLDDVLVIAMGEFGRTPQMGTQGSTDGRNHWPVVHVDGAGRRRLAARPGDRRDGGRRRLDQGAARHARRPGRDDLSPHGRPPGRHLSRPPRPAAPIVGKRRPASPSSYDVDVVRRPSLRGSVRLCSDIRTRLTADQRRVGPDDAVADVLMAAEIDRKRQRLDA